MSFVFKFLGATVRSVTSQMGWNGNASNLDVVLVEDLINGDAFVPVANGQPIVFTIGGFVFRGLQQKYERIDDIQTHPSYQVVCSDCSPILSNCKLILNAYNGAVNSVANLLNVYGYWEDAGLGAGHGFGLSYVTDAGMPWQLVKQAIEELTVGSVIAYGGPLELKSNFYKIDLSQLPSLPSYFRVGGSSTMSLTDFINTCCEAGNCDWFSQLQSDNQTIKIVVVSRLNQPPLGTIDTFAAAHTGIDKVRSKIGVELRNDATSSFLIGGNKQVLYKTDVVDRFYGFDENGNPIIAVPHTLDVLAPIEQPGGGFLNQVIGSFNTYQARLYCPELADILGDVYYNCTEMELRTLIAIDNKGTQSSSWEYFMRAIRNPIDGMWDNLEVPADLRLALNNILNPQMLDNQDDGRINLALMIQRTYENDAQSRMRRLKDYLSQIAHKYFGKAYLVHLPFVLVKVDPDSSKLVNSYDVSDGGWVDDIADLDGLPDYYWPEFSTQDGRFCAFQYTELPYFYVFNYAQFSPTLGETFGGPGKYYTEAQKDTIVAAMIADGRDPADNPPIRIPGFELEVSSQGKQLLAPDDYKFYAKLRVNNKVYNDIAGFLGYAGVLVLNEVPVISRDVNSFGGDLALLMNAMKLHNIGQPDVVPANQIPQPKQNLAFGAYGGLSLHPGYIDPKYFHIPLRSNILTYGPWYAAGIAGNTVVEQDGNLVPWNFAGYTYMNLAANAKVVANYSNTQDIESGEVELAGLPGYSLGDILVADGPNLTNIRLNLSTQGATTSYSFATYIPRFGQMGKYNYDVLKKLGLYVNNKKQENANAVRNGIVNANAMWDANFFRSGGLVRNLPPQWIPQSTHQTVFSQAFEFDGRIHTSVSFGDYNEIKMFMGSGDDWRRCAVANPSCFIRPYSVFGTGMYMPEMEIPDGADGWDVGGLINALSYNPVYHPSGNDILMYSFGDDLPDSGITPSRKALIEQTQEPSKLFGHKFPLIGVGYGFDMHGEFVPNDPDYSIRPDLNMVGPLTTFWNPYRKTWDCGGGTVVGQVDADIAPDASGSIHLFNQITNLTSAALYVYNPWKVIAVSGSRVHASYIADSNIWEISTRPFERKRDDIDSTDMVGDEYTLSFVPTGEVLVYKNGLLQTVDIDYTIAADLITFLNPIYSSDLFSIIYS